MVEGTTGADVEVQSGPSGTALGAVTLKLGDWLQQFPDTTSEVSV